MKVKVYDMTWKDSGKSVDLNASVFWLELNQWLVHRALVMQLANARINVAHTKTRWERRGSTRKLFRQKGTGRARAGASRSPIRKKGGVVFGPRNNQNFTLTMNKKERQRALFCVLSQKVANSMLVVVDKFELKDAKTKAMSTAMSTLPVWSKSLIGLDGSNTTIERAASNLKDVKTIGLSYLNMADLLKYETLIVSSDGIAHLNALAS